MFEFHLSYKEPGYHIEPEDRPFVFPPKGITSKIDKNLVEIHGRNGSGKTTLLNVLALAMGYLDRPGALETKPILKSKLQDLRENETLEYDFRILSDRPTPYELRILRKKGKNPRFLKNSTEIDPQTLKDEIDVLFLTEDDPEKVISTSKEKLAGYFQGLSSGTSDLNQTLHHHLMDLEQFNKVRDREKNWIKDIENHNQEIEKIEKKLLAKKEQLGKIESRDELQKTIDLLYKQKKIEENYEKLKAKFDSLKSGEVDKISRKIRKLDVKQAEVYKELEHISTRITIICSSLQRYGVSLDRDMLMEGDDLEFRRIRREIQSHTPDSKTKENIVNDMIKTLRRYRENVEVPVIGKPVGEVLKELIRIQRRFGVDRARGLTTELEEVLKERKKGIATREKIHSKISELTRTLDNLKGSEGVASAFIEAQKEYLALQNALHRFPPGKAQDGLLSDWKKVESVKGNAKTVQNRIQELEVNKGTEETRKEFCERRLKALQEERGREPRYLGKEEKLNKIAEKVANLLPKLSQWPRILRDSGITEETYSKQRYSGFTSDDYRKFIKAIGNYLGKQFEPIAFAGAIHKIKFFDIEKKKFTTKEGREILLKNLSQGQNKITALTGALRELGKGDKAIVLIDEISDLDPSNLQKVKNELKEKLAEGVLLLAVLVRPPTNPHAPIVEIKGWG